MGIREDDEVRLTPKQLAALRERYVAAIRAYHAEAGMRAAGRCASSSAARRSTRWTTHGSLRDRSPG